MNVQEFIGTLGQGSPSPVYFFCPSKPPRARNASWEPFLAERAVERFVETYVDPGMKDLC